MNFVANNNNLIENDSVLENLNFSSVLPAIFCAKNTANDFFIPHSFTTSNDFFANSKQDEQTLEQDFVRYLNTLGWKSIQINNLQDYLKSQIERLNNTTFSNQEWDKLYSLLLEANLNELKQNNYGFAFLNHFLILYDNTNFANNEFAILNQFVDGNNRYDVIFLINGLPFLHCELKTPNKQDGHNDLTFAFNQIANYYKNTSLHPLFRFVHLFLISNGSQTFYFANQIPLKSNVTRTYFDKSAFSNNALNNEPSDLNNFSTQAFKFTDGNNEVIGDLKDVCTNFLKPEKLVKLLFNYCFINQANNVFNVYRSYQIYAIEQALVLIKQDITNNNFNNSSANGYVWHATGTGKTLTSFGLVANSSKINELAKIIVVVDTVDLYEQTLSKYQKDYNSGQEIETPNSVYRLYKTLNSTQKQDKIIITTIQKLNLVINNFYNEKDTFNEPVLLIFDECHRGLYDKQAKSIQRFFMKSIWMGFTGTPIFNINKKYSNFIINSNNDTNYGYANTTKAIFGNLLAIYNTRNAQNDNLVLGWRIKNIKLTKQKEINDIKLPTYTLIDTSAFYEDEARLKQIVHYINNTYPIYTKQTDNKNRELNIQSTRNGFTALLTCNNIASACKYYALFKQSKSVLRVGLLFSIDANYDNEDYTNDESFKSSYTNTLLEAMRDFKALFKNEANSTLKNLNVDYYSTEAYSIYKTNLLTKFKRNEIDLIIVVRQLLTGFDAKTLNTLFVDKFLKESAEIVQMFSRTNRVFDKVKTVGNIVMFRNNDASVKNALSLYCSSNSANRTNEILQTMPEFNVIFNDDFKKIVNELKTKFPYSLDLYNRLTSRSNMAVENVSENNLPDFFKFALLFLRYKTALKDLKTYLEWEKVDDVYKIDDNTYLDYANLYKQIKKVNRSLFDRINIAGDVDFNVYSEYELEINKTTLNDVLTRTDLNSDYVIELVTNSKEYSEIFKSKLIKNFLIKHKEIEDSRSLTKNNVLKFDKEAFVNETLKEISKKYMVKLEDVQTVFNKFMDSDKQDLNNEDLKSLSLKPNIFNLNKTTLNIKEIRILLKDLADFIKS